MSAERSIKVRPPFKGVKEKGLQTHLTPKEKEAREVDESARSWPAFYGGPLLPQAARGIPCSGEYFLTSSSCMQSIPANAMGCVLAS